MKTMITTERNADRKKIEKCLNRCHPISALKRLLKSEREKAVEEVLDAVDYPSPRKTDEQKVSYAINWRGINATVQNHYCITATRERVVQQDVIALVRRERLRARQELLKELSMPTDKTDREKVKDANWGTWGLMDLLKRERARVRRTFKGKLLQKTKKVVLKGRLLEL